MKSSTLLPSYLLLLLCIVIYTSCEKEYSYEGGSAGTGGSAVYTLDGEGGPCTGAIINGTYTTGIALPGSNNIQIRVNVTSAGSYALTSVQVNGIKFSGAGDFTSTGVQTITLTGSGTPVATGTFSYNLPAGLGCTFFVTVTAGLPQMAHFTLDGAPDACNNFKVNGIYISGNALTEENTVEIMVNVTETGFYSITTDTIDNISFSQSGNFAVTGIQKVILKGSGTPSTSNIFIFTLGNGISGCTFSLTVLTPPPSASYVLESNPDHSCVGYAITGMYNAGIALTGINTIAVKVNVTDTGNFSISTDTINGLIFSCQGSFVSTGTQFVLLTGSGTPVSAGTFTFTPQIIGPHPPGGETCTIDIVVK